MMEYYSVVKSGIENHTTVDTANVDGSQIHDTDQNSQLPNRAFHLIPLHTNCCDRKGLLGLWAEEMRAVKGTGSVGAGIEMLRADPTQTHSSVHLK